LSTLASRIVDDIRRLAAFEPRENEVGDLASAYCIQAEVTEALLGDRRDRKIAGYKIAFNRQSSLDYYGLAEPCFAPLFSDQIHASGTRVPLSDFGELVIELEVAVRLAAPLDGHEDRDRMAAAIAGCMPAIELMDVRGAFAHDPSAAAAVAQRVYSQGAILGPEVPIASPDPSAVTASLDIDGIRTGEATGATPQDPLDAVAWLAGRLARDGRRLEAGMVVLTGAHLPGHPLATRCDVRVALAPLGEVLMRVV
jgi:2-keto-4-pentenoate hydratase